MLTDYHVHLRPDGPDTSFADYMTADNAAVYREHAAERGISELGVAEHIYRFTDALRLWDHELWRGNAVDDLDAYTAFVRDETDLKLGIEADFIPGREDATRELLEAQPLDYVVGSVHFISDGALDYGKYDVWTRNADPDKVWRTYFTWLGEAAASGLFDVLAHPDLVKYWGPAQRPWPEKDLRFYYELAMEPIAESGIAVEVSTAGLRKPVGEIYPSRALLEMVVDAGNPIALSSDAHTPDVVGFGYDQALQLLADCGVSELAVFTGRERRLEPLG